MGSNYVGMPLCNSHFTTTNTFSYLFCAKISIPPAFLQSSTINMNVNGKLYSEGFDSIHSKHHRLGAVLFVGQYTILFILPTASVLHPYLTASYVLDRCPRHVGQA